MTFNKVLDDLNTYEAGKPIELLVREYGVDPKDIIKLASNENPYGTSQKVIKKLQDDASNACIYPDDSMYELKEALANKFDVIRGSSPGCLGPILGCGYPPLGQNQLNSRVFFGVFRDSPLA